MLYNQKVLFLILFMIPSLIINAQNGTVSGKIVDNESTGLAFVNVLLLQASDSTLVKGDVTNVDGSFAIRDINPGEYLISASMVGFDDVYSEVIPSENNAVVLTEMVMTSGVALEEVTIKAKKPFIEMQADKIIVNVENSSVNAGNTALEVLQKSPGVIVDRDNNISLRGKQGVLVTINNKQQYMSAQDIAAMLETMPAENINSIEIIANPSAKYDAEGNSGIINIKLKKNENIGLNGQFTSSVRQGIKFSYNTGINLNYRSEKVNLYGGMSRYDWASYKELTLNRVIPFNMGITVFDLNTTEERAGENYDGKFGLDYSITNNTTIGLLAKYNKGQRSNDSDNMTNISGDNMPAFSLLNVVSNTENERDQVSLNFNVNHQFDDQGTEITFDADYSGYNNPMLDLYNNFYRDSAGEMVQEPYILRNNFSTDIEIMAAKIDFTKSIGNDIKLEVGAKLSMVKTDNVTEFESLQNEDWVVEDFRSNSFDYSEDVLAGYANVSRTFGKVSVQAGLRVESTNSTGNSITLDEIQKREYIDFFPSVNVSHTIGENHSLSYNYSRRLNRPNYKNLNPFIEYLDEYTFEKGNPLLKPQYSQSFGVNYGLGRSLFISTNYSFTKDAITPIIEQRSEENQSFRTVQNLEDQHSASLTVTIPKVWNEWFTTRSSITSFYNSFKSQIPSGFLDNKSVAYNIYVSNSFQLPKDYAIELTGNYTSSLIYGLFEIDPQYGIDIGVSTSVLEGKGNLKLGVDDIFNQRRDKGGIMQDDIQIRVNNRWDSRRAKLSFSYRFGNDKVKSARNRKTATDDEAKRISE